MGLEPEKSYSGDGIGFLGFNQGVSKNNGTPKSSILIGFSIINHPFWGIPIFGNTHIYFFIVTNLSLQHESTNKSFEL